MKTIELKVYNTSEKELNPQAYKAAWDKYAEFNANAADEMVKEDILKSLVALCEAAGMNLIDYEIGNYKPFVKFGNTEICYPELETITDPLSLTGCYTDYDIFEAFMRVRDITTSERAVARTIQLLIDAEIENAQSEQAFIESGYEFDENGKLY